MTCNTSLFSLARGIQYFYNVELLYPLDKFQKNLIFFKGNIKEKHHFYCVADTIKVMFFVLCFSINIKFVSNLSNAFAVILPQQRPVRQLKFAEKKCCREMKIAQPTRQV